jgi:hypothetical protein
MSIISLSAKVAQTQRDLADLEKKLSQETKAENDKSKRILQIQSSITKTTGYSTLQSKLKEIQHLSEEKARIQSKKAEISRKIADKNGQLLKAKNDLSKAQETERRKVDQAQKVREQEALRVQKLITQELALQKQIFNNISRTEKTPESDAEFDVFISHASEDKDDFVRPLAAMLSDMGLRVWYDESTLKIGDSLRRKIDHGLARSRFGIVVLSSTFFVKNWPQYELDGMVSLETCGRKVILPIWHKVSKSEVINFSPTLADKVAINSSISSMEEIVKQIIDVVGNR